MKQLPFIIGVFVIWALAFSTLVEAEDVKPQVQLDDGTVLKHNPNRLECGRLQKKGAFYVLPIYPNAKEKEAYSLGDGPIAIVMIQTIDGYIAAMCTDGTFRFFYEGVE